MLETRKDKIIKEQEITIKNQKELIEDLKKKDNLQSTSNAGLRNEIEDLKLILTNVANLSYEGQFSSELVLAKIKKLVCDYQSKN
ncbi:MAG: hypothetical protein HFJ30_10295 [Clostridia bacterium]|nr:hypothetical protein [Clostridia bacterium]